MAAYEGGGHAYHATMPTDALARFRDTMLETKAHGFDAAKAAQWALGDAGAGACWPARAVPSVAAEGFRAPGVVVSYTDDPEVQNGKKFRGAGHADRRRRAVAGGRGAEFKTFRLGLFGLDKLYDVPGTLGRLQAVVDRVL